MNINESLMRSDLLNVKERISYEFALSIE